MIDWNDKEQVRAYHRRYYHRKRKLPIFTYVAGLHNKPLACFECGNPNNLEIDHIDPKLKSFNIKVDLTLDSQLREELKKCQLLCNRCHRMKTGIERIKPIRHGSTYAWSKMHCSCRICRAARSEYRRCHRGGKADSSVSKTDSRKAESVGANPTGGNTLND